jgi:hypothetical protein
VCVILSYKRNFLPGADAGTGREGRLHGEVVNSKDVTRLPFSRYVQGNSVHSSTLDCDCPCNLHPLILIIVLRAEHRCDSHIVKVQRER